LICQQIEIQNTEAVNSFTYERTELTRKNGRGNRNTQHNYVSKQGVTLQLSLHAENINSEYTKIFMAIKLNIEDFSWTSSKLRL